MNINDIFPRFKKIEQEMISEASNYLAVPISNIRVCSGDEIYGPSAAWEIAEIIIDGERKRKLLEQVIQNSKMPTNRHNGQR